MKFVYTGPLSGVTLQTAEGPKEVMLHPNSEIDLPEDHPYTRTLVALKHLKKPVVAAPEAKVSTKSAKEGA